MVESVVSLPDVDEHPQSPNGVSSPSLKRRQSSEALEPDVSKRPRLDTSDTNGTNGANGSHNSSPPPSAFAASPSRRKGTLPNSRGDEKSRNRRLFGGLLSTLSASSNKPSSTAKRRDEIEQRQRERLKRDDEEIVEARRKKKEELDRKRRVEQKRWDEQSMRLRHANMRATAGFLRTETHPRIYWKPWEMSKEDEEKVRRQKEEVEDVIRRELDDREDRRDLGVTNGKTGEVEGATTQHGGDDEQVNDSAVHTVQDNAQTETQDPHKPDPEPSDTSPSDAVQECAADVTEVTQAPEAVALDDKVGDDDHGVDDIVEGHDEDQVIY